MILGHVVNTVTYQYEHKRNLCFIATVAVLIWIHFHVTEETQEQDNICQSKASEPLRQVVSHRWKTGLEQNMDSKRMERSDFILLVLFYFLKLLNIRVSIFFFLI